MPTDLTSESDTTVPARHDDSHKGSDDAASALTDDKHARNDNYKKQYFIDTLLKHILLINL